MNCRGAEKIIAVYWFVILLIVAGAIAYMVFVFYGKPYSVKQVESEILTNHIANCLAEGGYLKDNILIELNKDNLLEKCHLNFNVEDFSGWKENEQYYVEIEVYDFDNSLPEGNVGELVLPKIIYGNKNLKPVPTYEKNNYEKDTVVIHYTSTPPGTGETIAKNMVKGKINVQYILESDGTIFEMVIDGWNAKDYFTRTEVSQVTGDWEKSVAQHAGCGIGEKELAICASECVNDAGLLTAKCNKGICCVKGFNQRGIGIEVVNSGHDEYPQEQIDVLIDLVAGIVERQNIFVDGNHIIGHQNITNNKGDPGKFFPWEYFRDRLKERVNLDSSQEETSKTLDLSFGRNFYAIDKNDNQYIIKILALVGKKEKNDA